MLISKKPATNDVVVIKLANGEEIVGKMTTIAANGDVVLSKPIIAHPVPSPDGTGMGLAFAPFCPASEDESFSFKAQNLLISPAFASKQIAQSYTKMTTGLDLASPGIDPAILRA